MTDAEIKSRCEEFLKTIDLSDGDKNYALFRATEIQNELGARLILEKTTSAIERADAVYIAVCRILAMGAMIADEATAEERR